MTDEQIKQNAGNYASTKEMHSPRSQDVELDKLMIIEDYIAGAHSRDEEIKELKKQRDNFKDRLLDALDKRDQLRNPWISVKDRLPQLNNICFGLRDGKMPRICILVKKKNGECVFNTPNEEYEYPKGKITHWMPIPELKKGK